jgi:hypothetical protein
MNAMQLAKKWGAVDTFLRHLHPNVDPVSIIEQPTEDLVWDLQRGRKPKLHKMADAGVVGRIEQNYLYYTRRFPLNVTNNTIGGGAVTAGDYLFFTNGVGDQGTAAGYFSLANLTLQQTNMASGGKIPTGRGYQLFEIGITFNTSAAPGDIAQLLDTCNMRYEKQNSSLVVQQGPIKFWPGGMGIYGFASTTATATTIQAAANGMPALANVRRWKDPRLLSSNEQFQYVINAASATPNNNTTVALTGFLEMTIWLFGNQIDKIPG